MSKSRVRFPPPRLRSVLVRPRRASHRAQHVAIRANELALRQLGKNRLSCPVANHRTHCIDFREARQVIPMHHEGRKDFAAVCAWHTLLERVDPLACRVDRGSAPSVTRRLASRSGGVVRPVVRVAAIAAVRVVAIARVMKRRSRLQYLAARAAIQVLQRSIDRRVLALVDHRPRRRPQTHGRSRILRRATYVPTRPA